MKHSCGIRVLCACLLLAGASALRAQTSSAPSDPAITSLSVMGVVTDLKPDTRQAIVTTAAGNQVTVTLSDRTEFMRIPPGEKTKDKFIKISPQDFGIGDSVFARGRISEDRKNMPALEFYVMSKGDIAEKRERERAQWRTRGIAGTVTAVNLEAKEISLDSRTSEGAKPVVVAVGGETKFRRYAPDSVRFSDAKASSFTELKVGDQLRALGTKSPDGARFTSEEVVSGSFQTLGGTVNEVDLQKNEVKITDVQSHQTITVVVSKDSSLRRLTAEMLSVLMPAKSGDAKSTTAPAPAKGSGDLQEMFDQMPALTLQDLKAGDSLLVSSTKGADPARITAIAIVSGVGPILQNMKPGQKAVSLGAMSLGGP